MRTSAAAPDASAMPIALPAAESRSASVSTWRTSLSPPAPSATRTAISRPRDAPRASIMLAIFVHAISSSSPVTAISTSSGLAKRSRRRERPAPAGSDFDLRLPDQRILAVARTALQS